MNMLNVVQKLALVILTVSLYSSTFLCAATETPVGLPDHTVALYNTTTLDLDVTFQINNDGHFGDPIKLHPNEIQMVRVVLMCAEAKHIWPAICLMTEFGPTEINTERASHLVKVHKVLLPFTMSGASKS